MKEFKISVFCILAILFVASHGLASGGTLDYGLIASYNLDENVDDISGNGFNGVAHGGLIYSTGILGEAAIFDGIDDYIDLPDIGGHDSFTASAWVKVDTFDFSAYSILSTDDMGLELIGSTFNHPYSDINDTIYYFSWDNRGGAGGYVSTNFSPNAMLENQWAHIAIVGDQANSIKLYFNGVLTSEAFIKDYPTGTYTDDMIGAVKNSSTNIIFRYFKGAIDEIRFYGRALSSDEIVSLYNFEYNQSPADISVTPDAYDFGFVSILDQPRTATITITNDGGEVLTVSGIELQEVVVGEPATNAEFKFVDPIPFIPAGLVPGSSIEVIIEYSPKTLYNIASLFHVATANLVIFSDDEDEPVINVGIFGKGSQLVNIDQGALAIVSLAGTLWEDGDIIFADDGESGANKFNALLDEIITAGGHIAEGDISEACDSLWGAYKHTDGSIKPKDHIFGDGAIAISDAIYSMMLSQNCEQIQN